jgi:DNA-binding NtrC family response regulator
MSGGRLEIGSASICFGKESPRDQVRDSLYDTEATEDQPDKLRVLIVDDERLIADTCAEILEDAGFHTGTAYDGWTALNVAAEFHPDYLLTDVLMPRMNGVELAICISQLLPATRILLFSGQAGISDILSHGREQGYDFELIAKPLHPTKLIEHLRKQ